jgi:hypothetical protein
MPAIIPIVEKVNSESVPGKINKLSPFLAK